MEHVPDRTPVRYIQSSGSIIRTESIMYGRAVGWQTGTPRMGTARGDTLIIPRGAKVQVLLPEKKGHTNFGAIAGYVIGTGVIIADCGGEPYCGEQDPRGIIGLLVGALAGAIIRTDDWRTLPWTEP